jgi:alkylated DNA repair dioxygenase AlkB
MSRSSPSPQADLFGEPEPGKPEGLFHEPQFLSEAQERAIVEALAPLSFTPFQFQGYEGKRRVRYFGWRYDYDERRISAVEPMPAFLLPLREAIAAWAGLPAQAFEQALVNQYDAGSGIGWHKDKPQFGEVAGVSLLSACVMRFRRARDDGGWARFNQPLGARSAYRLTGPARSAWEHSIASHDAPRYSITFRTLR